MREYNGVMETGDFDPMRLDGLSTGTKLKVPKTNWVLPLDKPPYMAYGITCGMTPFLSCIWGSHDWLTGNRHHIYLHQAEKRYFGTCTKQ